MSELTYYKLLSAALYLITCLMFYRRINEAIARDENQKFADICNDSGIDVGVAMAIAKTLAFVVSLFWPVAVVASKMKRKKP